MVSHRRPQGRRLDAGAGAIDGPTFRSNAQKAQEHGVVRSSAVSHTKSPITCAIAGSSVRGLLQRRSVRHWMGCDSLSAPSPAAVAHVHVEGERIILIVPDSVEHDKSQSRQKGRSRVRENGRASLVQLGLGSGARVDDGVQIQLRGRKE